MYVRYGNIAVSSFIRNGYDTIKIVGVFIIYRVHNVGCITVVRDSMLRVIVARLSRCDEKLPLSYTFSLLF